MDNLFIQLGGFEMAKKAIERSKSIQARVNEVEYSVIEEKANSLGLQLAQYMRMICLHVTADSKDLPSNMLKQYFKENDNISDEARKLTIQIRVTDDEYNLIEDKALNMSVSTSNYMRMICLHSNVYILFQVNEN